MFKRKVAKITKYGITYLLLIAALMVGLLFATANTYAAPLTNVTDDVYPGAIGQIATHTIKFTTATDGTIAYVQIIFEPTFNIARVKLRKVSGIGPGIVVVPPQTPEYDVVYIVAAPVPVPPKTDISLELKHIVNTPHSGNYTVTVSTRNKMLDGIIDGPTKSTPFKISLPPTVISVIPDIAAQGSKLDVTIVGKDFQGTAGKPFAGTVSFGRGITVNKVTFVNATKLTANTSIDKNATPGPRDVTMTNPDGGKNTLRKGFSVQSVPTVTTVEPDNGGQGATNLNVTIAGTKIQRNAKVSFGAGIDVIAVDYAGVPKTLVATINIKAGATVGTRDVTATNPDGGKATLKDGFKVNPAPEVLSVTPKTAAQGSKLDVTIVGKDFQGTADKPFAGTVSFGAGITVYAKTFKSSTKLTANITINIWAAPGPRDVTVTNPDGGVGVGAGIFTVLSSGSPKLDIETDKDIYKVGEPLTVLLDLNNPGDAFNAVIGLFYIGVGMPVVPVLFVPTPIPAGFSIVDYPLFSIPSIPPELPLTNAFVCVLLDRDAGELLDWDVDIFGIITAPTVSEKADIERKAEKFVKTLTLADLTRMKPVSFNALAPPKIPFSSGRSLSRLPVRVRTQTGPVPKVDKLGLAYPVPANPETWIPYQLSKPANVKIKIYSASGKLVRILSIGQREAGYYLNKDKAAYWDGKNDTGERVSSGIYFYTLEAGNFAATRKLVILK